MEFPPEDLDEGVVQLYSSMDIKTSTFRVVPVLMSPLILSLAFNVNGSVRTETAVPDGITNPFIIEYSVLL